MKAYVPAAARGRGLQKMMVVLAGAALLLGARSQIASAAPPALTASENPVMIASPATTKAITLSYDLGGALSKATVNVAEAGGPTVLSQPTGAQSGAVPLTVTLGKTYNAQLLDPIKLTAVATLQITTQAGQGGQGGGCGAAL